MANSTVGVVRATERWGCVSAEDRFLYDLSGTIDVACGGNWPRRRLIPGAVGFRRMEESDHGTFRESAFVRVRFGRPYALLGGLPHDGQQRSPPAATTAPNQLRKRLDPGRDYPK